MRLFAVRIFVVDEDAARSFLVDSLGSPGAWEIADSAAIGLGAGGGGTVAHVRGPAGNVLTLLGS